MANRLPPDPDRPAPDPVKALERPEAREHLKAADVVFGVDVNTGEKYLFFGESLMKRIVRTGEGVDVQTVSVALDFTTTELEYFCAAVKAIKGSCCFRREGDDGPPVVNAEFN